MGSFKLPSLRRGKEWMPSKVAIIWWWPSWSLMAINFIQEMLRANKDISWLIDIFEPRDHTNRRCKWCVGAVSEELINTMRKNWLDIPDYLIQSMLDGIVTHTGDRSIQIVEKDSKQIFTVYRWWGPEKSDKSFESFDNFLLDTAAQKWANVISEFINDINEQGDGTFTLTDNKYEQYSWYDLLVIAVWVRSTLHNVLPKLFSYYKPPAREATQIFELYFPKGNHHLENKLHFLLSDTVWISYSWVVPKGSHNATLWIVWPEVKKKARGILSENPLFEGANVICSCWVPINVWATRYKPRWNIVILWDAMATKRYKWWIETAYRVAKFVAETLVRNWAGKSAVLKITRYLQTIEADNLFGKLSFFSVLHLASKSSLVRSLIYTFLKLESEHWSFCTPFNESISKNFKSPYSRLRIFVQFSSRIPFVTIGLLLKKVVLMARSNFLNKKWL